MDAAPARRAHCILRHLDHRQCDHGPRTCIVQRSRRPPLTIMSAFDSTKTQLGRLLQEVVEGKIQLPDFQRGWVWDDEHIRSLLVSIARSFPIGAVMLLETGGEARFQMRPVEGVTL